MIVQSNDEYSDVRVSVPADLIVDMTLAQRLCDILSDYSSREVDDVSSLPYFGALVAATQAAAPVLGMNDDIKAGLIVGFIVAVEYVRQYGTDGIIQPVEQSVVAPPDRHEGETAVVRRTGKGRGRKGQDSSKDVAIG